ncbi:type ISP restriction/modification enzyme [Spirulina major]|uniref:type ISP restriction/modification enzyme n=1 Tax=Spirulina major TaxID=270636 RepID=UPI0009342DDA|nr:type ISP restriction/modification enzyme [Spirulina major]
MFDLYLKELIAAVKKGNATEHTHRPTLQRLLESLESGLTVTNEPKRIQCGAPDFVIIRKLQEIGYLEAKDVGIALKKVEKSDQMKRYLAALGNLILTDYVEFRWYVGGVFRSAASLGSFDKKGQFKVDPEGQQQVELLLKGFLEAQVSQARTPKELAQKMASLAQLIRDAIAIKLKDATEGVLFDQYESFQKVLISGLTRADFADMYAQTICYGLFAARCNTKTPQDFSRKTAAFELPKTNPFLRDIFDKIAGIDLDDSIAWAVDILANILKLTDMAAILQDFGKRTRREDPVVHFYETFLAEYDPKMRQSRGVYYTPEPVVSYIVRSVDYILKEKFGIKDGLASKQKVTILDPKDPQKMIESHQVLILDPAVGTGTFLHGVIDHIYESFKNKKGMWSSYVGQHLLPRLFGFELLMAPYTVAHMKLGLQLQELGYEFDSDERLKIYLTNTLQEAFQIPQASGFMTRIKDEAEAAKEVKQERPVMVVLGNPPYSYQSSNIDPWIVNLVRDYYQVDGKPLGERNPKGLQDDYVKFIRFAQHRIQETGYGVVAFITNHGYLDNPTFRGMRQNLMQTFDEIYILDLHGNSKKKEVSPDGSPDQNVFDIQQGVAIGFFIKYKDSKNNLATVYHHDLYGIREIKQNKILTGGKYYFLNEHNIQSTEWNQINPDLHFHLFQNQNSELSKEIENFWNIKDIFLVNTPGIVTARDHLTIQDNSEQVLNTILDFSELSIDEATVKYKLPEDSRDWKILLAQKDIKQSKLLKDKINPILYRPFDVKYTYYTGKTKGFHSMPRHQVMRHIVGNKNLALISVRQVAEGVFNHILVSNFIIDNRLTLSNKGYATFAPLYLYPSDEPTLFDPAPSSALGGRRPNLDEKFIQEFTEKLNLEFIPDGKGDQKKTQKTFAPEDIFNYIYAVFHSPTYRSRYAEFLKIDFPRVPLTSNKKLFWQLATLGDELVQIHLMNRQLDTITGFPIEGDNMIDKLRYTEPTQDQNGRVYINKTQYIDNVPPDIYNFQIGGYQVCNKWLKDRKKREFTDDDFEHYSQIVVILKRTKELMNDIDQVIEKHGGFPIQ